AASYPSWFWEVGRIWDEEWTGLVKSKNLKSSVVDRYTAMPEKASNPIGIVSRYLDGLSTILERNSVYQPLSEEIYITLIMLIDFLAVDTTYPSASIPFIEDLLKKTVLNFSNT